MSFKPLFGLILLHNKTGGHSVCLLTLHFNEALKVLSLVHFLLDATVLPVLRDLLPHSGLMIVDGHFLGSCSERTFASGHTPLRWTGEKQFGGLFGDLVGLG